MNNLPHYASVGVIFQWVLLTLVLFRITRFVTSDTFPPMAAIRRAFVRVIGEQNRWSDLIECNWCVSIYLGTIGYWFAAHMLTVPLPVLQAVASMAVTGFVGNYDE